MFIIAGDVFLGWPNHINPDHHILPLRNGSRAFNILANHAVFDREILTKFVPNNPKFTGAFFIVIVTIGKNSKAPKTRACTCVGTKANSQKVAVD